MKMKQFIKYIKLINENVSIKIQNVKEPFEIELKLYCKSLHI